jgi:hypothetical protein
VSFQVSLCGQLYVLLCHSVINQILPQAKALTALHFLIAQEKLLLTWLAPLIPAVMATPTISTAPDQEELHTPHEQHHHIRRFSTVERELTDVEKEELAAYEGHDADIPSNEGYVLDERGELKRRGSIAALHRKASHKKGDEEAMANGDATKKDIEKAAEEVSADESDDPNVVWWNGPDDPENPLNFSKAMKILNITIVSAICFVTPLGSSMFAPGVPELMADFKNDNIPLSSFVVSVYILGFAIGPLFFAPLSEIYGRMPVYHVCNFCFLACTIGCALATNINMFIGFRFLAGTFGSAPLTNGEMPFSDVSSLI